MPRQQEVPAVDVKEEIARQVRELVADHLPIVPPELDGCHVEVQRVSNLSTLIRVKTPRSVRYFEVRVSEKL